MSVFDIPCAKNGSTWMYTILAFNYQPDNFGEQIL